MARARTLSMSTKIGVVGLIALAVATGAVSVWIAASADPEVGLTDLVTHTGTPTREQ